MKQRTTEKLKLVQWVNDGYPPIDLNQQITHVNRLVNAYEKLREDNIILAEAIEKLMERSLNLYVEVLDIPYPTSMNEDLRLLSEAYKAAKEALNKIS